MDLIIEINKLMDELTKSIKVLRQNGNDLAIAERNYKVKLRQEALKLRNEQDMPVTLINQIIYGIEEVAKLRYIRDVAQSMYDANKEHINVTKLKIKVISSQLNMEWGNER